jgi:WS/DGAT/MGAT family acyltransferase
MRPFDKARSPWEAVLYEGLEGGKAAYALKMHHSATDGIGGVQLLGLLHSRRREPSPSKSQPPAPQPGSQSSTELIARSVLRDAAGVARGVTPTLRGLVSKRPDKTVTDAVRFGSSLRRVLGDSGAQPSPLLRGRSLTWRFLALDVAFADLRAAGKAVDASLNDAFLAALLGAFRRYHEQQGVPIDTMPVAIPISVRRKGDAAGGNRFAAGRLAGPVGIVNPAERMAAIRTQVRAARDEPALDGAALVAPVLSRLPGAVLAQLAGGMTKANDLQASNIPGIREDVYLAGAKIERAYPFGPLPGCAAMITLLTHGETACVGVNLDPAAITDVACFGRCLVEGFNEVLALHPGAAPALLRS